MRRIEMANPLTDDQRAAYFRLASKIPLCCAENSPRQCASCRVLRAVHAQLHGEPVQPETGPATVRFAVRREG